MGIRKKQYIDIIDMWNLADRLNVSDHRKELEVYARAELDDMMINSIATDILSYRPDLEVTDANIAYIMNTIMEYVTVEYRALQKGAYAPFCNAQILCIYRCPVADIITCTYPH